MSKMLFDFCCNNNHTTEHYVDSNIREVLCQVCGHTSTRVISPISTIFKGTGFPTADDKWAREHDKTASK